jgi:hypothetical protein
MIIAEKTNGKLISISAVMNKQSIKTDANSFELVNAPYVFDVKKIIFNRTKEKFKRTKRYKSQIL